MCLGNHHLLDVLQKFEGISSYIFNAMQIWTNLNLHNNLWLTTKFHSTPFPTPTPCQAIKSFNKFIALSWIEIRQIGFQLKWVPVFPVRFLWPLVVIIHWIGVSLLMYGDIPLVLHFSPKPNYPTHVDSTIVASRLPISSFFHKQYLNTLLLALSPRYDMIEFICQVPQN